MTRTLLTAETVAGWRRRLTHVDREVRRLEDERSDIQRKLEAVAVLFGELPEEDQEELKLDTFARLPEANLVDGKATWRSEIMRVLDDTKAPITFAQLREGLEEGPLRGSYARSQKGYHNALRRLYGEGTVVKHRGWLFRPEDLKAHLAQVQSGAVEDLDEVTTDPVRVSPLADEVKTFLARHPEGVLSGDIIAHLRASEEFAESVKRATTGVYNVLTRLLYRGEVRKEGKVYYPLKENDPPESGSDTEGVPASSEHADEERPRALAS